MKKILSLMMVLALAVSCMFVFASCGGGGATPNEDPEEAKDALKDADYEVEMIEGEALEYAFDYDGLEAVVAGVKMDADIEDIEDLEDLEDMKIEAVTIFYFEDEDAAKDAFEDIEDEAGDSAEEMGIEDYVCKQSGKMVWIGTKAAVKAAK